MDLTATEPCLSERVTSRLAATVGSHAMEDAASRAIDGRVPAAAVAPASVEELAACVRVSAEEGAALVVWGGGTQISLGAPPARYDVALLLSRLDRVLTHDPADLTATVEAGCPAASLDRHLAASAQRLPVDVPCAERATIGGTLASGAAGARAGDLGALRNLVLGATAVTADGRIVHSGGRVVKNVTGYDLHKLYARSLGSLAVLTELHVRLVPRPEMQTAIDAAFRTLGAAAASAERARLARLVPAGLAVMSPGLARGDAAWHVVCGWEGTADDVRAAVAQASAVWEGAEEIRTVEPDQVDPLWRGVADQSATGETVRLSISLPPAAAIALLETIADGGDGPSVSWSVVWYPLRGRVTLADRAGRFTSGNETALDAALYALRARVAELGGWLVGERLPAALKTADRVWGAPPPWQGLLVRVKEALDPRGVLAPGRLTGGL